MNDGGFDEITLSRVYPLPKKCKLFYHYDFGDDWYFEIRKSRTKPVPPKPDVEYSRLVQKLGPNPDQYPEYG